MANMSGLASDILVERRNYFIDKVKEPFLKAMVECTRPSKYNKVKSYIYMLWSIWNIVRTIRKYPEPTKENCNNSSAHALMDIWDEFFELEENQGRDALFRAIRRVSVSEVEHDNYYSQRITWFILRLVSKYMSGDWAPLEPWAPMVCWNDPKVINAMIQAREEFFAKL